jgi:hypothetical protein
MVVYFMVESTKTVWHYEQKEIMHLAHDMAHEISHLQKTSHLLYEI